MGEIISAYILFLTHHKRREPGRPRSRREDNMKMDFSEVSKSVDSFSLVLDSV
jgi:hypothetical protein